MNEQEFVVQQFQKAFAGWRDVPIVLYGLGKNTEAILQNTTGFLFAGLMDAQNTGSVFWGLQVLSEREVIALQPRIVIIARESVVPVIYERIAHLQRQHGIPVYDFKGELQGQKQQEYKNHDLPYWKATEEELRKAIAVHDCISFDIFDTLLMRRVLEPKDVFHMVERILEAQGEPGIHFRQNRIQAEDSLEGYPSLDQIYEEMGRRCNIPGQKLAKWRRLELWVEEQVLVPRRKMKEIFQYALSLGKRVYLVSDMYIPASEMEGLLVKCGIEGYRGLLVSCDYKKGKSDGSLFEAYRQMAGAGSYLHIGDNRRDDGEKARESGLDTFLVYSAYEMWMASSMQGTLAHVESLEQRCILGTLVWRCCEDPFALQAGKGMLQIDTPEKLGYVFLGALYGEFINWLISKAKECGTKQLLLPARDGYLIEKMLEQEGVSFEPVYFKASRRAVSVAALEMAEDILLLAGRTFQGTLGQLLWQRFGVSPKEGDRLKDRGTKGCTGEEIREYVLGYQQEILQRAARERRDYMAYLEKVLGFAGRSIESWSDLETGLETRRETVHGKRQAIFDFVAGGTVQYYMQRLLGKPLQGFYFATMNHPQESYHLQDSILSAYGNICSYGSENQVAKHYLFLETIMVDGCPTLQCVDNGRFVYEGEGGGLAMPHQKMQATDRESTEDAREQDGFGLICKVQEGILEYQRHMQQIRGVFPGWRDERSFADTLFGRLFDGSCQVDQEIKAVFVNDDVFDGVGAYRVWKNE